MNLLAGKKGLILNIANDRSIAAHIAHHAVQQGRNAGSDSCPWTIRKNPSGESARRWRNGVSPMNGFTLSTWRRTIRSRSSSLPRRERFEKIDFLVHSLAFADRAYLQKQYGNFTSTPRSVFAQALDISAYSLIALARGAAPLMPEGGSIIALTYLGGEKVVPGYNVMGVAKAALESAATYLAFDLGPKKIRVNTISAGPVRTLSAMAVGGIDEMFAHVERKAPLQRNIDGDEVGKTAVYLLSDLSSGVTGENIYVDGGFNTVGV